MKRKLRFLYYLFRKTRTAMSANLFRPPGFGSSSTNRNKLLITFLLLCSASALAQDQTPPEEFVIGATFDRDTRHIPFYYNKFNESGMNTLPQYADDTSKEYLTGLNFMAYNSEFSNEWIYFYSTAYYSKWEAEEDQINKDKVGFKHRDSNGNLIGSSKTFSERQCWSTEGLTAPACSLIYGPHYHQEKVYKRWYDEYPRYELKYTPRFSMALHLKDENIDPEEFVCRLYVVARYHRIENGQSATEKEEKVLKVDTLRVADFAPYDSFKVFYLGDIDTAWYQYPLEFREPEGDKRRDFSQYSGVYFSDRYGDEGIQFCIDWLGDNSKCNLYIDYIELYDNDGGQDFADDPDSVTSRVINYAQGFPQQEWPNMKYWGGCDEPSSIDNYIPLKTVDAILDTIEAPRLITTFYPWWEIEVNGDTQLVRYYNAVQPKKLIIDFFPFLADYPVTRYDDWETTRKMLQICSSLQPGFWYQAQAAGLFENNDWSVLRRPDSIDFKAQNMLALAHGVKGLIYWSFRSPPGSTTLGILDSDDKETDLYREIRDHFTPRLKGKLGKTLMDLNYTGDYLELRRYIGPNTAETVTENYLTLSTSAQNPIPITYYFHAGFFEKLNQPDNDYFFLTNLITTGDRWVNVGVANDCSSHPNNRFRNIEPEENFDTTFTCEFSTDMLFPPGEGYLFQVAPVVKYGGRLIHDETISNSTTLTDEMIIENAATLTINTTYNVDRDIRIKAGGRIVTTTGGTIKFYEDSKLIVEGTATISGTAENKLILDFLSPSDSNGVVIELSGSLTISNCEIKNAGTGIFSELNANYLNAQNVDFINCETHSISIAGRSPGMNPTPPLLWK